MRHPAGVLLVILGAVTSFAGCSNEPSASACGDGVLDPHEACDDGNRESGDACTSTCQIPGTLLECTTLIEGTDNDENNALLALPDLSFVAAGSKYTDGHQSAWVGRYDDSGASLWQAWPPPADEVTNALLDLAADSSGGYWMLIYIGGDEELIHFDSSGEIDARQTVSALDPMAEIGTRRLLVADEDIWLAGAHGPDSWLGRFDTEAHSLSTIFMEDHAGFHDVIWAIARSESEVAVAATVDTSSSYEGDMGPLITHSNVILIRFDIQGQEVGRHLLGSADPEITTVAYSIAADRSGGGSWVANNMEWRSSAHTKHGWHAFSPARDRRGRGRIPSRCRATRTPCYLRWCWTTRGGFG
jgi:cysteine-rich repeat protein